MVRARLEVRSHRRRGLLHRTHANDAAGQPFRSAGGEVGLVEALPQPGVPVVRQARIDLQVQVRAAQLLGIVAIMALFGLRVIKS